MQRARLKDLKDHLKAKEFSILIGPRQTGKSTLLRQLLAFLQQKKHKAILLNLERQDILTDLDQSPEAVFRYLPLQEKGKIYVLIDEVQYLKNPTHFLKLLYDEYHSRLKIIATGSSAFYIDRKFSDSLAGRKKIFEMRTLDFKEFLMFKGNTNLLAFLADLQTNNTLKSPLEAQLWLALEEYINYGGYPAVVLEEKVNNKIERLKELRDSFVKRDILEANIPDEDKFYRMMVLLSGQIGNLLNVNEVSNTLRISNYNIEQYLFVLQKCFHAGLLRPFYQNLRKELTKMPKLYFNDLGLRNVLINNFAPIEERGDKGGLLENFVYRHLLDKYSADNIKFWRTADGNEVDFIIEESIDNTRAIEVKFSDTEIKKSKYKKFTTTYPNYPLNYVYWRNLKLLLY